MKIKNKTMLIGIAIICSVALAATPLFTDNMDDISGWKPFSGTKSTVNITQDKATKAEGSSSLKLTFSVNDWGGIGKEFKDRLSWNPKNSLSFQVKGDGKYHKLSIEVTDNGGERFNKIFAVNNTDWQTVVIPFKELLRRKDWQPDKAPDDGLTLTKVEGVSISVDGTGSGFVNIDNLKVVLWQVSY